MQGITDAAKSITGWKFMEEPLYRWFMFLGAWLIIVYLWGVILSYMKRA